MEETVYEVNLYINGTLIGDCRHLAQNLSWARRRTKRGADSIDFTLNDVLFNQWLQERNTDINNVLKPIALECRIIRNGVPVVGGFLATMPAYSPRGSSADLEMRFDGFLNLLDGVYIYNSSTYLPVGTVTGHLNTIIQNYISMANTRSSNAGKGYGFVQTAGSTLASITNTFNNFKTVKGFICDRCDNTEGAGPFDVIFDADKHYKIVAQSALGDVITDWVANYPADINSTSAVSISASEVSGFASAVLAIGSGEISSVAAQNTALLNFTSDASKVSEYGYYENLLQDSSISIQNTLNQKAAARLAINSNILWKPEITLTGRMVSPTPTGSKKIWLGDIITILNKEDLTGQTNGQFRVNELEVSVSESGGEIIRPTLERYNAA